MPVFVEWRWMEKTETFLVIFHFWDDEKKPNLRMRIEAKEGFETVFADPEDIQQEEFVPVVTNPFDLRPRAYLSWAPSHPEFCFLTEVLTYANLINGLKPNLKGKLRPKLEGKVNKRKDNEGHQFVDFEVHSELLRSMPEGTMVSFAGEDRVSYEVRLEYLEYLRKLLKPYLM